MNNPGWKDQHGRHYAPTQGLRRKLATRKVKAAVAERIAAGDLTCHCDRAHGIAEAVLLFERLSAIATPESALDASIARHPAGGQR